MWLPCSDDRGLVMDSATERFQLSSRQDSTRVRGHICCLTKDNDDFPKICSHDSTSSNDGEVSNRMVVDATQVNGMHRGFNDFHVAPGNNAAMGTTIDQSGPIVVWYHELPGIDVERPGA
jgi:hypothetical protein